MSGIITVTDRFARLLAHLAGVALIGMMLLLVSNIVLRTFTAPIQSTYELVSMAGLTVGALALGEAQVHKAHVSIDIATSRLQQRAQLVIGAVVTVISIALFVLLVVALVDYGQTMQATSAATEALSVPHWPLVLLLLTGVVGLIAALVGDLDRTARSWRSPSAETEIW